jgi:hypothetical protein
MVKRIFLLGAFRYWFGEVEMIPDYTDEELEFGWQTTERLMRQMVRIARDNDVRFYPGSYH